MSVIGRCKRFPVGHLLDEIRSPYDGEAIRLLDSQLLLAAATHATPDKHLFDAHLDLLAQKERHEGLACERVRVGNSHHL